MSTACSSTTAVCRTWTTLERAARVAGEAGGGVDDGGGPFVAADRDDHRTAARLRRVTHGDEGRADRRLLAGRALGLGEQAVAARQDRDGEEEGGRPDVEGDTEVGASASLPATYGARPPPMKRRKP
ncbi:hypothetical protein GCM10020227_15140 [Streptomyces flavovirens]